MKLWKCRTVMLAWLVVGSVLVASCGQESDPPKPKETTDKPAVQKPDDAPNLLAQVVAATDRACDFLAKHQNDDGGWGGRGSNVGITGLVIESMANMPVELRNKYSETIADGVSFILENQLDNGSIVTPDGMVANYCTSISARALIALDKAKYKEFIDAAVRYTKGIQGTDESDKLKYGSMGYGSDETKGDIINTGEALELLAQAGVDRDDEVWMRAMVFLARTQSLDEADDDLVKEAVRTANDGGAIYRSDPTVEGASKAGLIRLPDGTEVPRSYGGATYTLLKSLLFAGLPKDNPRVQAAYNWIADNYTVKEHPGMKTQGLFYFYYTMARTLEVWGSPVIVSKGVEHKWAEELATEVLKLQKDDGSWVNTHDRWWESDPTLVSAYAINVLNICRGVMAK
jgi:squalene-hopene/tetraprenyl-beta-curcumene cyclase